ncbi:MAG: M50 family metallopeptidase [Anaerolineae bacterium]
MSLITILLWLAGSLVFILGPLILVHELGHFIVAKLTGVRVEEFGIGFPPRALVLFGKEGTLAVNGVPITIPSRFSLPLGLGRNQHVKARLRQQEDDTYRLESLKRIDPTEVAEPQKTDEGLILRGKVTKFEPRTQYTLNWIPFGAFVRMTGEEDPSDSRSLAAQPKRTRLAVLLAGIFANLLMAFFLLTGGYMTGHPELYNVRVGYVEDDTAAAAAGLQADDVIVEANGILVEEETPVAVIEKLQGIIQESPGQPLPLTIRRDGQTMELTAIPGEREGQGYLGISLVGHEALGGPVHYPLHRAAFKAGEDMVETVVMIAQLPRLLRQGEVEPEQVAPSSVVGINEIIALSLQETIEVGRLWYVLQTAAMVSYALALTNLLPLPALDGGRVLFVIIEAIRGKRVPPEVESAIHFAGMVILLTLMAFVMLRDILNPMIPWDALGQ